MRTRKAIAASTVLALGALAAAAAQEQPSREEVFQQFQKLVPPDAVTQLQIFHANGFRIESSNNKELGGNFKPNGNEFQSAIVTADGGFTTVVEKGRPTSVGGGLAMFHRQSGVPILSVADADGDGRLDGITYTSVDAEARLPCRSQTTRRTVNWTCGSTSSTATPNSGTVIAGIAWK